MTTTLRCVACLIALVAILAAASDSAAALIGVHEILLDGATVNITPNPQPILAGNGTGSSPLLPGGATLDAIVSPGGGLYVTPDSAFSISGTVAAENIAGRLASLLLTVTVMDNRQVGAGGDVLEFDATQDWMMSLVGPGVASGALSGNCNPQATAAGSGVQAGVVAASQTLTPPLVGDCAPLGEFNDSNFGNVQVSSLTGVNAALFFDFGQGQAGQAISLPLEIRVVPEPGALALLGLTLLILARFTRGGRAQKARLAALRSGVEVQ